MLWGRPFGLAVAFVLAAGCLLSPAVAAEWTTSYDHHDEEPSNDSAVAAAMDAAGYTYVLANCMNEDDEMDVVVLRLNPETGAVADSWIYDTEDDEEAVNLVVSDAGDEIYVLAYCDGYQVVKFDTVSSDPVWTAPFEGDEDTVDIALQANMGVAVTGTRDSDTELDYYTVSYYATNGGVRWEAYWDGGAGEDNERDDHAKAVVCDPAGYVYVTGT